MMQGLFAIEQPHLIIVSPTYLSYPAPAFRPIMRSITLFEEGVEEFGDKEPSINKEAGSEITGAGEEGG